MNNRKILGHFHLPVSLLTMSFMQEMCGQNGNEVRESLCCLSHCSLLPISSQYDCCLSDFSVVQKWPQVTEMRPPRHKRFFSKPTLHCLPIRHYTRLGNLVTVLLLLLSGDMELNPGPIDNQVICVCSVNKESGHMLPCEHCLQ